MRELPRKQTIEELEELFEVLGRLRDDGRAIVFEHQPTPHIDDWPRGDLSVVEVASAAVRPLPRGHSRISDGGGALAAWSLSPAPTPSPCSDWEPPPTRRDGFSIC